MKLLFVTFISYFPDNSQEVEAVKVKHALIKAMNTNIEYPFS